VDPTLSKITVGEWLPLWLDLQVQLKPTMIVRYGVALRRHPSRWELAPFPDHCLGRLELGARPGRRGTCVGNRPVRHGVLSLALSAAVRDGRLMPNVAEGVSYHGSWARPKCFLTHDQVLALAERRKSLTSSRTTAPSRRTRELRHIAASLPIAAGANVKGYPADDRARLYWDKPGCRCNASATVARRFPTAWHCLAPSRPRPPGAAYQPRTAEDLPP
jgi:hypothetical protein